MSISPRQFKQPAEFDLAQEERLLARYKDYIGAMAHKIWSRYGYVHRLDEEDFRQEGYLTLIMAVRSLDWENYSGSEIDNFLKKRIWGAMHDFVRASDQSRSTQWRKHGWSVRVELGLEHDLTEDHSLPAGEYPVIEMLNLLGRVNEALEGIELERDRRIVMLALYGYDNVAISGMIGGNGGKQICPSRVSQILSTSGLFRYADKDSGGKGKRIKDGVSRSTELKRRKTKGKDNVS